VTREKGEGIRENAGVSARKTTFSLLPCPFSLVSDTFSANC
jgi:hypothetical protein